VQLRSQIWRLNCAAFTTTRSTTTFFARISRSRSTCWPTLTCSCKNCLPAIAKEVIPEISLEQIVPTGTNGVDLLPLPYEDGQLLDHEAQVVLAIAMQCAPNKILEIGTYFGHTALRLAHVLPHAEIHTVDLPHEFDYSQSQYLTDFHLLNRRLIGHYFAGRPESDRIKQHLADTALWDFSLTGYPSPTFFFIDGSHSYEYVRNDSEKCYHLCKGSGIFLWHDLWHDNDEVCPGVRQLLEQWRSDFRRDIRRIRDTRLAYWDSVTFVV
jgi:methyltransferase family protein